MSAEQLDQVRRRTLVLGESAKSIAKDLGFDAVTVGKHARRFREAFIGPMRPCVCGRPAGHAGWCARTARGAYPLARERVASIRARLLAGDPPATIKSRFQIGEERMRGIIAGMTPAEQHSRWRAMWRRIGAGRTTGANLTAQRDPLFARILAAMPRSMPPALRDEACAEMYLALLEGEIATGDIEREARRYRSDAYREWADRFGGARSMDAKLGEDGERTLHDVIADETMLESLDEMRLGHGRRH